MFDLFVGFLSLFIFVGVLNFISQTFANWRTRKKLEKFLENELELVFEGFLTRIDELEKVLEGGEKE